MTIKYIARRHYSDFVFEHDTLRSAVDDAINELEYDEAYPNRILDENDKIIWQSISPFVDRNNLIILRNEIKMRN